MIRWFNGLDTSRRLFVLAVVAFYAWFMYVNFSNISYLIRIFLFQREVFDFQMDLHRQMSTLSAAGMGMGSAPISPSLSAIKQLGLSLVVVGVLSYALFRKRS